MSTETKIPNCVGIIMDGNRRWAIGKGMPALKGHHAGGETLKKTVQSARDLGIKHIIFYTFSTENWKRSEEEVSYLINLIGESLQNELEYFNKEGGVLHYAGDLSRFSPDLQEKLKNAEEKTSKNKGPHVYFALNYGGRQEIIYAVKKIIQEHKALATTEDITEEYFSQHLQTYPMPDPDIIIRTSGEMRLSGFLPWQGVYSELFFTKTLWPDFSKEEFTRIIEEFGNRERRIGK
ncbi:MAG: polyprenyl diphosphate synthase [Candidatus Zambryskibacteria bacterium]|nr:polyprenyl diphosphate synthase [Candidatus Zambryskibacteria bacterium]